MAEPNTIYKLIILQMLDESDSPISNTKLSDFFLSRDYTNYFTVQQIIHGLQQAELITAESTHNNTQYRITAAGRETLSLFPELVSPEICQDIREFFKENNVAIREDAELMADYYKTPNQKYEVRCQLKQKNIPVLDFKIQVKNTEIAEAICNNWHKQSEEVYTYLLDLLVQ